jgi:hypothetical protein
LSSDRFVARAVRRLQIIRLDRRCRRMRRPRTALVPLVPLTLALVAGLPATAGLAATRVDPRVGHGNDGLVSARTLHVAHCPAALKVARESGTCTHGADEAPAGVDVTHAQSAADLRAQAFDGTTATSAADVPGVSTPSTDGTGEIVCEGDGTTGKRIQVLYVRTADTASRFAALHSTLEQNVVYADSELNASAAQTGGARHFRFVTDPSSGGGCSLDLQEVVLPTPPSGTTFSFGYSVNALKQLGYTSSNRKYLMLTDASVLCGVGSFYGDDSAAQSNYSNGYAAEYARADTGCWHYAEAHELMHNLGGVQDSAPHTSGAAHCYDGSDIMCYNDGGPYYLGPDGVAKTADDGTLQQICASGQKSVYDCNKDDYFNTSPTAGSYLATHWDTAGSAFLIQPQVAAANTVQVTAPATQTSSYGTAITPLQVVATDATPGQALAYAASGLPAGLGIDTVTGVVSGTPAAAGTSTVVVTASDATGAAGSATFTWTVNPVVPGTPSGLVVTPGRQQLSLSWTAPTDDGGAALTGYRVTITPSGGSSTTTDAGSTSTSYVVAGLADGTAYQVSVAATNAVGTGGATAPATGTPTPVAPGSPTSVTASAGSGTAVVSFVDPADDGDSPVTGYTVTASTGQQASGSTSPITLTGLTNGVSRTFTVTASNAYGTSSASAPSNAAAYWPTSITLSVPTGYYGKYVTLSGFLRTSSGAAVASAPVALYYHRANEPSTTWHYVTTRSTSSRGLYGLSFPDRYNGTWRAVYAGDAAHAGALRTATAHAATWFIRYPSNVSLARYTSFTWNATTAAPSRSVVLEVYSGGRWRAVSSKRSDASARVAFTLRTPHGSAAYRLVQPADTLLLGFAGPTRSVHGS